MTIDEKRGRAFERLVAALQEQMDPGSKVIHDHHVIGKSGTKRQIDVAVYGTVGSTKMFVAVECKDYSTAKVNVEKVDAFDGKLGDIEANKGIMVTTVGYTADALKRAENAGIDTCVLRPASDEDWENEIREIHGTIIAIFTRLENPRVETVDGAVLPVKTVTQFRDTKGNTEFFDRIFRHELSKNNTCSDHNTARLEVNPPLMLMRDEEPRPRVRALICEPYRAEGPSIEMLLKAPWDWVFVKYTSDGIVDERSFLEFQWLRELADERFP